MTHLKSRFEALKKERGPLPTRDGAQELGVSEAALLNALCGDSPVRLRDDFRSILEHVKDFGRIMGLVRNDHFVAMPIGAFNELSFDGNRGHATGGNIDFTFDLSRWASAFAMKEMSHGTLRRMIQFFDDSGDAVFKVVLWSDDGNDAFDAFMEEFRVDASTPLNDAQKGAAGWQSFTARDDERIVTGNAPAKTQDFLQACIDNNIEITLQIPTNASMEIYRGPLRKLEPRNNPGWIDLRYPHFTTHFGVGEVAKIAIDQDGDDFGVVTMVDASDRIICRVANATPDDPDARDAWSTAIASKLLAA